MNRMNKDELLKFLETVKCNRDDFYLLSSSMLVLREIYPDAGDLDIAVSSEGLKELKKNYNLMYKDKGFYIVTDNIECICVGDFDKLIYKPDFIDGYYVQNINEYYNYLINSKREKDIMRIPIVEDYMHKVKML